MSTAMIPNPRVREILAEHATRFVLIAAFPRLAAWVRRWPTRLRPRGVAVYVAVNTAIGFALRTWLVPYLRVKHEQFEQARTDLRGQLGREPTDEELWAYAKRRDAGED